MQSSLLDRIFPPSRSLLPQHDRHSSRSPPSTTPRSARSPRSPPASSSTILRPALLPTSSMHHSDPLLHIDRAAKSLQRTIQSLLDAQSEGLLAGLTSSSGQDDVSSNGSLTPTPTMSTTTTSRRPITLPMRQPPQKRISLRGARRGLSRSMHDFAALKQEEERFVEAQFQEREDALNRAEAFLSKREGIQSEIASISSENSAQSVGHLRAEANDLDVQIRELENRLFEMKARHRYLIDEAQQLENSVQSKLSSYNASLELIDNDIKRFLARPPISQPVSGIAPIPIDSTLGADSFYALNPKRRTLRMANDHWREEREDLKRRKKAIQWERTALEDGGRVWREVVNRIQTFEKDMKAQMQKLSVHSISQQERDEGMTTLLGSMDKIMEFLEQRLQEAEEKDWKLLICCIGAELEAFREGREMLIGAFGLRQTLVRDKEENRLLDDAENAVSAPDSLPDALLPQGEVSAEEDASADYDYGTGSTVLSKANPTSHLGKERRNELLPDLATTEIAPSTASRSSESENDDPGPDFLISHT